jgi:hypothetical protein
VELVNTRMPRPPWQSRRMYDLMTAGTVDGHRMST